MKHKNVKRIFIMIFSSAFLLILYFGMEWATVLTTQADGNTAHDKAQKENSRLHVKAEIKNEIFEINSWYDAEKGMNFFFIPQYLSDTAEAISYDGVGNMNQGKTAICELSNVPIMYIEMDRNEFEKVRESKENKEKASITVISEENGIEKNRLNGTIKARGNASFTVPKYKKSYTVEFDEKIGLCDMNSSEKWLLLAHYYDDTHIRDKLTFEFARELGMQYIPEGEFINLYVNGDFQGIYFLCEKIEIAAEKINITDMEDLMEEKAPGLAMREFPYTVEKEMSEQIIVVEKGYMVNDVISDITGGYLLELEYLQERYDEESSGFISDFGQNVVIKSPKYATVNQVAYIKDYYQQFEEAVRRSNEEKTDEFLEFVDLESFVNKYLVEEVSKNMDANFSSQYIYKDSDLIDGRFYAGPVWDYDRAYDNKVSDVNKGAKRFWANGSQFGTYFWGELYENPFFFEAVKKTYMEKISPILSEYADETIWLWEEQIHDSVIADMYRYKEEYDVPMNEEERLLTEMEALSVFLKERKEFLDKEWGND